jgi:hypothetical protein
MDEKPKTRHGMRAKGTVTVTIPMSKKLSDDLKELAYSDQRTLAAWVRLHLGNIARRSRAARKVTA